MPEKRGKRLDREDWFDHVLESIRREGGLQIRIHRVARGLGVTEGSFYWHFKNRDDFLRGLAAYWEDRFTEVVPRVLDDVESSASNRLLALGTLVIEQDLARYDFAMQALGLKEPVVARAFRRVYKRRFEYVGSLFEEMGFRGRERDMRAEAMVVFISLHLGQHGRSRKERLELLRAAHAMFTK